MSPPGEVLFAGPAAVSRAVAGVGAGTVAAVAAAREVLALAPRLHAAVVRAEDLLLRAEVAMTRFENATLTAEKAVGAVGPILVDAEHAVVLGRDTLRAARGALDRADRTVTRAETSVDATDALLAAVATTSGRAAAVVSAAEDVVSSAGAVTGRAEATAGTAAELVEQVEATLVRVTGAVDALIPLGRRLAESLTDREVDAAALLLARLPELLRIVDTEALPVLRSLGTVAPDLRDVLKRLDDLHRLASGLPGAKRLRKRGEDDPVQVEGVVERLAEGPEAVSGPSRRSAPAGAAPARSARRSPAGAPGRAAAAPGRG